MSSTPAATATAAAPRGPERPGDPLWDFYVCGLPAEDEADEDTDDEMEAQDWSRFERRRALQRLAIARAREAQLRVHK